MNLQVNIFCSSFLVFLLVTLVCLCFCSPINYKEITATPKKYVDRFKIKKEYKTIPTNSSTNLRSSPFRSEYMNGGHHKGEAERLKSIYKVKSIIPGEKTMRQSDDDDDDDDGGEYEGVEYNDEVKGAKKENLKKDSVPMMIIRELDMVALEFPLKETQKEWSEWSPCSKPCGNGLQSRWRLKSGEQEKEQQFRPCHVADCGTNSFQHALLLH